MANQLEYNSVLQGMPIKLFIMTLWVFCIFNQLGVTFVKIAWLKPICCETFLQRVHYVVVVIGFLYIEIINCRSVLTQTVFELLSKKSNPYFFHWISTIDSGTLISQIQGILFSSIAWHGYVLMQIWEIDAQ